RFRLDLSVRLEPPPPFVPAKAGTQGHLLCSFCRPWVPAFAGTNGLRWRCSLNRLAMEREVEALALGLWFHAQADHHVDDPEKDQRHDRVVDKDDGDADALIDELHRIAFEHTSGAAVLLDCEHAGEERPHDAANRMHPEGVERVIVAEHALEAGAA